MPADVQRPLRRAEIIRSLRTTDASEALRRQSLWEPHVGILFNHVRRRGRSMTPEELEALTQRYLLTSFDEIEDRLALESWSLAGLEIHSSQLNERCHALSVALAGADMSSAIELAGEMAPHADELVRRKLARRLIEVQLKAGVYEMRAIAGEPLRRPIARRAPEITVPEAKPTPKVSEMAAMYAEERLAQGRWSPKTAKQGATIFGLVAEILGDPPIGEVTKAHIRQMGLDITKLPANMAKRYPGLSVAEVLAKTQGDGSVARLESRSVNKHYQHVRTLFAWATEHDHIAQSPAAVLHDVEEGRAQDARKVFDDEDILAFFAEIENKAKEPYGLWIPRIMAYTGCRMGEAAQLRKVDIRMEQDVFVFDFNEESEQKNLKTDGSTRCVPIHPRLLELGFLEFVAGCAQGFLFPERIRFTANAERGNMDLLSKQLNRWLRNAGVVDKRKSVQSFRGTLVTRLKDLEVAEYNIAQIVGHENDNITTGRYGKKVNLKTLHEVVARLRLPI